MKTNRLAAMSAAFIAMCAIASTRVLAQTTTTTTSPSIPVGSISAYPTAVQTGTKPTLTWNITYPSIIKTYIDITDPGTITPKVPLICDIRMLGLGVTSQGYNGSIIYWRTRGRMLYNGSSTWMDIYDGKQTDAIVTQQGIVKSSLTINANQPMTFGGQYGSSSGSWATFYTSTDGIGNVRTLVNGDTPPPYLPAYNAPSLETFLKPYLDDAGNVSIGPLDVIVFMELTHTDPTNPGYDFQDLVMLLSFRTP